MESRGAAETIVRSAVPTEATAIAAVKIAGWKTAYAHLLPAAVLQRMTEREQQVAAVAAMLEDNTSLVLVAERDDVLVGIAICVIDPEAGPYLESIHVLPGSRGHGVGRRLLATLAAELEGRGHRSLELHVIEGNVRTMELYQRLGGRVSWRGPAAWADEVSSIAYRWDDLGPLRVSG